MATSRTFGNGKKIKLTVGAPWWSWIWGGLIYQPGEGTVKATRGTSKARVDRIFIESLGASDNPAGQLLTNLGHVVCTNCRELTHQSHQFGFPAPPWMGGGGFKAVGYQATVEEDGEVLILSRHWNAVGADQFARLSLPADFQT